MESELLKEPWIFPHTKANLTKEEDPVALSAWEEDFQDLSSWCMDTFQGQCDFHIGESATFKLSGIHLYINNFIRRLLGMEFHYLIHQDRYNQRRTLVWIRFVPDTKYEGNGVSIVKEKELKNLTKTTDEKLDLKMDTVKTTKELNDNRHLLLPPSELVNKYGLGYNNEENNTSSSWLMSPKSIASKSTSPSKQYDADVSASLQSKSHDLNYACPTSLNTVANQRETWDELRTIETTGSDTFDLLSYLWEVC